MLIQEIFQRVEKLLVLANQSLISSEVDSPKNFKVKIFLLLDVNTSEKKLKLRLNFRIGSSLLPMFKLLSGRLNFCLVGDSVLNWNQSFYLIFYRYLDYRVEKIKNSSIFICQNHRDFAFSLIFDDFGENLIFFQIKKNPSPINKSLL